ncbi:MAG: uncharacterized protein JWQ25_3100, partial [Daejeonella sp.]|nr:uncharacterized protein [Daejeonella sp.]
MKENFYSLFRNSYNRKSISAICCLTMLVCAGTDVFSQGATTPFKTLEAEAGTLAGGAAIRTMNVLPATSTVETESSGRKLVELNALNESVTFSNTTGITANTIVARVSIPDASGGGGTTATLNLYVNGVFRQALTITSKQSWVYGGNGLENNPSFGQAQVFYSETRALITGAAIAPGSTIMLKKDAANTSPYYHIDLIDLENRGAAKAQPANTLSVISYGAIADDNIDDTTPIQNCINAAQSQGKGVWIPAGLFRIGNRVSATGITISGAGMWYTDIYKTVPIPNNASVRCDFYLKNCTIRDMHMDANAIGRERVNGSDYGVQPYGAGGWLVERVWIEHADAGVWASGTNGMVKDCRVNNTWGDGINLNNGIGVDKLGKNLTAQNNYVRCTGDDGYAINNSIQDGGPMDNAQLLNNTSIGVWRANGLRIAGGKNHIVRDNLICDPAAQNGLVVGVFHAGAALESALVENNTVIRGGGFAPYGGVGAGILIGHENTAVAATVRNNTVIDSYRYGILIGTNTVNVTLESNIVNHPATTGVYIRPNTAGTGQIRYNTVTNLNSGQVAYKNDATSTFAATLTANSWQQTITDVRFFQDFNYGGTVSQTLPVGDYTQAQLLAKGVPNDWASSARVPSGRKVIMYSGDNFTGTSWTLTYDTPNLSTLSPTGNDVMSSCKVQSAPAQVAALAVVSSGGASMLLQEFPSASSDRTITVYPNPVST